MFETTAQRVAAGERALEDGDMPRAAHYFDRAITLEPHAVPATAYAQRASIFLIQNETGQCLEFVARVVPSDIRADAKIGGVEAVCLWHHGLQDEAVDRAERLVTTDPTAFTLQFVIGTYYRVRMPQRAVDAYLAYLKHRPELLRSGDDQVRIRLALAQLRVGDYRQALESVESLSHPPGDSANIDNIYCAAFVGLREYLRAKDTCEHIITDPGSVDRTAAVWFNLGRVYLALGVSKKARLCGEELNRKRPNIVLGDALIAYSYWIDGKCDRALYEFALVHQRAEDAKSPHLSGGTRLINACRAGEPPDIPELELLHLDRPMVPVEIYDYRSD